MKTKIYTFDEKLVFELESEHGKNAPDIMIFLYGELKQPESMLQMLDLEDAKIEVTGSFPIDINGVSEEASYYIYKIFDPQYLTN